MIFVYFCARVVGGLSLFPPPPPFFLKVCLGHTQCSHRATGSALWKIIHYYYYYIPTPAFVCFMSALRTDYTHTHACTKPILCSIPLVYSTYEYIHYHIPELAGSHVCQNHRRLQPTFTFLYVTSLHLCVWVAKTWEHLLPTPGFAGS